MRKVVATDTRSNKCHSAKRGEALLFFTLVGEVPLQSYRPRRGYTHIRSSLRI